MQLHRALAKVHKLTDQHMARELGYRRSVDGLKPSCRPGCGACCRQVATAPVIEALGVLQALMPQMDDSGLLALMRECAAHAQALADPQMTAEKWFALGRPCPVLADEMCRAHAMRPTTCRTHTAYSPAELCADPKQDTMLVNAQPLRMAVYKSQLGVAAAAGMPTPLVPLQYGLLVAWYIHRDPAPGWTTLRHTTAMQAVEGTAAWAHLEANGRDADLQSVRESCGGELPTPYPIWEHLPLR